MKVPYIENDYGQVESDSIKLLKIAEQYSLRQAKSGFLLNILLIGRENLGCSTLMNSLFSAPLVPKNRSTKFTTTINEIIENEVKLKIILTTYHENDFNSVCKFIKQRHEEYYEQEMGSTLEIDDRRIHVCIYIFPHDKILLEEINGLKLISKECNFIPIISKADMYTCEELEARRKEIFNICKENEIFIYNYEKNFENFHNDASNDLDIDFQKDPYVLTKDSLEYENEGKNESSTSYILATIGSEKVYDIQGNIVRGRRYTWGFVDIANEKYSDFKKLQRILLKNNYEDLLYKTDTIYYNKYRKNRPSESEEDYKQLMKKRLSTLQTQLESMLIQKHKLILEKLKNEEYVIENQCKNYLKNKNQVEKKINDKLNINNNKDIISDDEKHITDLNKINKQNTSHKDDSSNSFTYTNDTNINKDNLSDENSYISEEK